MIHCLHGAVGSFHDWDPLQSTLTDRIQPIDLWRLFDHASPSLPEAGHIIASHASQGDLLLGYSMGGRLALHALLAAPDKWQAAIIVSAHPGLTDGHASRRQSDETWAARSRQNWKSFLAAWNAQPVLSNSLHGLRQAPASDQEAVALSFRHWSLGRQDDLRPGFSRITCPVLWLTGENDQKFTELAAGAISLFPQGRHRVLPGCGHRLPWEKPDLFRNAVENFLASIRITGSQTL